MSPSALPLREIRTLLNKPGEEIDERVRMAVRNGLSIDRIQAGYIVELDGNIEKNASGELEFVGSATTGIKALPDALNPVDLDAETGMSRSWQRKGRGDVYLKFWLIIRPGS